MRRTSPTFAWSACFCALFLDERARPVNLRRALRRWTPDRLLTIYTVEGCPALRIQEERVVTPNDTLACRLTLTNSGPTPAGLHLLLWSLQTCGDLDANPLAATVEAVERYSDALSFAHRVQGEWKSGELEEWRREERQQNSLEHQESVSSTPPLLHFSPVFVALGGSRLPESWTVNLAETTDTAPLWQTSLFPDKFQNGTLPREMQAQSEDDPNGLLHLALHYVIEAEPGGYGRPDGGRVPGFGSRNGPCTIARRHDAGRDRRQPRLPGSGISRPCRTSPVTTRIWNGTTGIGGTACA